MKLRRTAPDAAPAAAASSPAKQDGAARSAQWTNGSVLGSKLVTVIVLAAWACGPIAFFTAHDAKIAAERGAVTAAPVSSSLSALQQAAGALSVGFVSAWLSATTTDSAALDSFLSAPPTSLPDRPFKFRNMAVASVEADGGELVDVVLATDVLEVQIDTDGKQTQVWNRRYFQVDVATTRGRLAVVGLPAPVAGPTLDSSQPALDYPTDLPITSKPAQSVALFLDAYLAGQGETEPYVSPSTKIPAITPAPFAKVSLLSAEADQDPAPEPADGDALAVLATVSLQNQVGQQLTGSYTLQLRARAGRWEISQLETSPLLVASTDATNTPHPSPSGDQQEGTK